MSLFPLTPVRAGLVLASLALAAVTAEPAPAGLPQWERLVPGAHAVGFRVLAEYDRTRSARPPVDFEGRAAEGDLGVPVQVGIWYPAAPAGARVTKPLPYAEYLYLAQRKERFAPLDTAARRLAIEGLRGFAQYGLGAALTEAELRAVAAAPTAARRDVPAAGGRFPVLLAGVDGALSNASVLFEYLASHGYVVVATPSLAVTATQQATQPALALDARVRALEYVAGVAHRLPNADTARVGVLGVNFDGMAALVYQMKNMRGRAVVSIDGWEGKRGTGRALRDAVHYDPRRLRVPYFLVLQDEPDPPPHLAHDPGLLAELRYSARHHIVVAGLRHAHLVGNPLAVPAVRDPQRRGYEYVAESVRAFLDGHVRGESGRLALLRAAPDTAGGLALKRVDRRPALPPVPLAEEVERLVGEARGVERLARIFREARRADPGVVLFTAGTLNLYAFRFARQGRPTDVLALRALAHEAFPTSAEAAAALGDAYAELDSVPAAAQTYERARQLAAGDGELSEEARTRLAASVTQRLAALRVRR